MMTVEQVNEKFKGAKVKFSSYYKYTFTFEGQTEDGYSIQCKFGGDSEDIYKFDVDTNEVNFIEASIYDWNSVTIRDNNGKVLFSECFV